MLVADMPREVVFGDDFAHIVEDLRRGRDRRTGPGLEAVTKRVKVTVGADAGIAVRHPGAAKAFLRLQHDKARARQLLGQMIGAANTGDAGADDQDVEMFSSLAGGSAADGYVHLRFSSRFLFEIFL